MTQGSQWTYEERHNESRWFAAAAFLVVLIAAAIAVAVTGSFRGMVAAIIFSAAGVALYAVRSEERKAVVLDRQNDIVRKMTVGALRKRQEVRALGDFDRLAVWERRTPVDAGYHASLYLIVLLGSNGPLQLLTTDDEQEAAVLRDEIAVFLRFQ